MTFHSLFVRELAPGLSDRELTEPGLPGEIVDDLSDHAREFSCKVISQWAEARSLKRHFVDGCWVRIAVTEPQLNAFYEDLLRGRERPDRARANTLDGFLIEAEEF